MCGVGPVQTVIHPHLFLILLEPQVLYASCGWWEPCLMGPWDILERTATYILQRKIVVGYTLWANYRLKGWWVFQFIPEISLRFWCEMIVTVNHWNLHLSFSEKSHFVPSIWWKNKQTNKQILPSHPQKKVKQYGLDTRAYIKVLSRTSSTHQSQK